MANSFDDVDEQDARYDAEVDPALDDDLAHLIARPTPFPGLMFGAGILWILAGVSYVGLFGMSRLLQLPLQTSDIWLVIGAFFFILDGIQLMRGRFRDPQVDGVISLLLGLFFLWQCWYQWSTTGNVFSLFFCGFIGAVFFAPGILVLLGRKQYLAWQAEQAY